MKRLSQDEKLPCAACVPKCDKGTVSQEQQLVACTGRGIFATAKQSLYGSNHLVLRHKRMAYAWFGCLCRSTLAWHLPAVHQQVRDPSLTLAIEMQ